MVAEAAVAITAGLIAASATAVLIARTRRRDADHRGWLARACDRALRQVRLRRR